MFSAIRAMECLQGDHVRRASAHVAERLLEVIALDIDHDNIGELQRLFRVGGDERLLLLGTARNEQIDLGIFGLNRRDAAIEQWNLPKAARAGALHADDELGGAPALLVESATTPAITAPTKPKPTTTTISRP